MKVRFFLKYQTRYGESLQIQCTSYKNGSVFNQFVLPFHYHDSNTWAGEWDAGELDVDEIRYTYQLLNNGHHSRTDNWKDRSLHLKRISGEQLTIWDDWQDIVIPDSVYKSRTFTTLLPIEKTKETHKKSASTAKLTHVFQVHTALFPSKYALCLLGSIPEMGNWNVEQPCMMKHFGQFWVLPLNLNKLQGPISYKYAIWNKETKKIVAFESSSNRQLNLAKGEIMQVNQYADFNAYAWKGAGVNVQLTSLRTNNSWGVGDFSDLKMLVDWSVQVGLKMIQLLPINDTTSTHTQKDSYPYSAISAFAQHPVFLDIKKIAKQYKVKLSKKSDDVIRQLNQLSTLDYESATALKIQTAQSIFDKIGNLFLQEEAFKNFFNTHLHWLKPYAVFSVLRDKYHTADYAKWETLSVYEEHELHDFADAEGPHFSKVSFYYFLQYHLHLQLTEAVAYAHKNGVIIKGDLPIGVGRHSVDTWMNPHLFHMDMQAGAPPDAFAVKGQNWSFPTYNWEVMKKDHYAWWRLRLQHMSHYFDATRIDHVLGFFRIWSIPMEAIEGILGYFVPALAMYEQDFTKAGLHFDEYRLCEPFITDDIIQRRFGSDADWVRQHIIINGQFAKEFNTQRKIAAFLSTHTHYEHLKTALFDLLADVILIRDEANPGHFHFRIAMQETESYQRLPEYDKQILNTLFVDYFYQKQNDLWYQVALHKLDAIQQGSDMMICAEDLGMVPDMVEGVLSSREMLALQVQRMPKKSGQQFSMPEDAPYLSVVTPSTHDMSTIRQWWLEEQSTTHDFYYHALREQGELPKQAEAWVCQKIIQQHLESPAMWSVFLLQDLMSMDEQIRNNNLNEERINIPADPDHYWNYRMHLKIEDLYEVNQFNQLLKNMIQASGR